MKLKSRNRTEIKREKIGQFLCVLVRETTKARGDEYKILVRNTRAGTQYKPFRHKGIDVVCKTEAEGDNFFQRILDHYNLLSKLTPSSARA